MNRNKGQALVEYLVLVCLVAVASIAMVSVVGRNLREQYANISAALRNEKPVKLTAPPASAYGSKQMNDFAASEADP